MKGNSTISNRCRCHRTAAVDHRTSCRWRPPYALYTGIPVDKVRDALRERLGAVVHTGKAKQRPETPVPQEYPITDIETRHATYEALLSLLTLAPDHRDNLLCRGLSQGDIERLGYKTTPVVGTTAIAKELLSRGHYLAGVPGFYRNESEQWVFIHERRGILVPVRNRNGQIQGLQIRRDDVTRRKFRWVSSAERKDGCKAEGWPHLAGAVRSALVLTEGPMKGAKRSAISAKA